MYFQILVSFFGRFLKQVRETINNDKTLEVLWSILIKNTPSLGKNKKKDNQTSSYNPSIFYGLCFVGLGSERYPFSKAGLISTLLCIELQTPYMLLFIETLASGFYEWKSKIIFLYILGFCRRTSSFYLRHKAFAALFLEGSL